MISTHILDTTLGQPAAQVPVTLEREQGGAWREIAREQTNADGRISFNVASEAGNYRLTFQVEEYFRRAGRDHFFLNSPVVFRIQDTQRKYHIPMLLNPFGYSTYRGS